MANQSNLIRPPILVLEEQLEPVEQLAQEGQIIQPDNQIDHLQQKLQLQQQIQ